MLVKQILKGKGDGAVITVAAQATVGDAAKLLSEHRIGALIVADEGIEAGPRGILSERDIVRELGRRGTGCLGDKVSDLMTTELVSCRAEESADTVLAKMTEGRFRHMPVLDGERMIGLISIGDVVKARLSELAMERDALQDMVMGH
ncbi:CBS domain-containing protein [Profundibacterium mesophilum]|uniref:IMP dehydrogenase n=1 Tax=Profundibacterium mesophilum KAUST100406-0324 TaxID=1037889 RepID=A0A921NPV4_9RHOB|nr:CBS domain-containing protein [Profundibacterium mesophilum]KAF0674777.1 IMP dehydrogenase [Profundibacterium mesophilum KAUST100406-0324]